jgi:hypothetical protein
MTNLSLYTVSALLILDTDGQRVLAKYYAPPHHDSTSTPQHSSTQGQGHGVAADLGVGAGGPGMPGLTTLKEQKTFEKGLMDKIRRGGGELFLWATFLVRRDEVTAGQWLAEGKKEDNLAVRRKACCMMKQKMPASSL